MTARQKEIATVRRAIQMCKEVIAAEREEYELVLTGLREGLREDDSAAAFYRESIEESRGWLAKEEARLAVLEAQEAGK